MTLLSLGWAAEYADAGIGVQLPVAADVHRHLRGREPPVRRRSSPLRSPEIMADAAVEILSRPPREATGSCYIDSEVLTCGGQSPTCPATVAATTPSWISSSTSDR